MPDIGKTSKMFDPVMLSEFGTVLCSDEEVYDHAMESLLNNDDCDPLSLPTVVMLGTFYKRGSVEIKVRRGRKAGHMLSCRTPSGVKTRAPSTSATGWSTTQSRASSSR